jgi:hypothetical protein
LVIRPAVPLSMLACLLGASCAASTASAASSVGRLRFSWPTALGHGRDLSGHPAGVIESASQEHLDLGVEAAEVGSGPPGQGVVDRWVDAQQQLLALGAHV